MTIAETPQNVKFTQGYRKYVLGILVMVYVFNFIDRQILTILMEPIRLDLKLTDSQLGLLSGIAFAVFYTTFGIPIARHADKNSRVNVISFSLLSWSVMTALCGLAMNFWQLMLGRIGVAVGEAGASPPSHSLISDYFAPEHRATAFSIYSLGIPIGVMIGYLAGGWLVHFFDWRTAFVVVGLPGIVMAFIVRKTVIEPPRGLSEGVRGKQQLASFREVASFLWSRRSFRHVSLAGGLHAFVSYGIGNWIPSFLVRSYHMGSAEIGTYLALIAGIVGGLGTFAGGYICDRFGQKDRRLYVWIPGVSLIIMVPLIVFSLLAQTKEAAMLLYIVPVFLSPIYLGPTFAVVQGMVQMRMRAIAAAVLLFILNLIGMGFGPLLVGMLSDYLKPEFGAESLRYAMIVAAIINMWAAVHYFIAARTVREDHNSNPDLQSVRTADSAA
ncbi:MAG: MFS transporter [Alphaproteobacteria bacterium]|nr:MFS transporter [Alphaproteobacteria bacterium]